MSTTIDKRVVEMQFDNSNFEKNVSTTMSTLDKLKEKLRFKDSAKGFEELERSTRNVDFNSMSSALDKVSVKFDALSVAAITAMQRITNAAIDTGAQLVKSLSVDQIMAGYSKYEQKTANVQTIMNSTGLEVEQVNKYLEKLMWFSDETSYSFTDMTSSLATLLAAGADIDKIIPMITGIANATAYAGKDAAAFSRAIFNLNQSYSAGALTALDWKSVMGAGVNSKDLTQTIIDTARELGRLNDKYETSEGHVVTLGTFTETLKDKWADTEVMEAAFGKFSELSEAAYKLVKAGEYDTAAEAMEALSGQYSDIATKAFEAAQQSKSFKDSIEATKDAVSSGWMKTFELIFGDFEEARELWTEFTDFLWDAFAAPGDKRNDILTSALTDPVNQFRSTLQDVGIDIDDFEGRVKDLLEQNGLFRDGLASDSDTLSDLAKKGVLTGEVVEKVLLSYAGGMADVADATVVTTDRLDEFQKLVNEIMLGEWGNGAERMKALADAGYDYAEVQGMVNTVVNGGTIELQNLTDAELTAIGYTEEEIESIRKLAEAAKETGSDFNVLIDALSRDMSGRELIIDTVRILLNRALDTVNLFKASWTNVFGELDGNKLYNVLKQVHDFVEGLKFSEKTVENLSRTFEGFFTVIKIGWNAFKALAEIAGYLLQKISPLGGSFLNLTGDIGDVIKGFDEFLTKNKVFETAVEKTKNGIDRFGNVLTIVKNGIISFASKLTGVDFSQFSGVGEAVVALYEKARESFPVLFEFFDKLAEKFKMVGDSSDKDLGKVASVFDTIFSVAAAVLQGVKKVAGAIWQELAPVLDKIRAKFEGVTLSDIIGTISLVGIWRFLKKLAEGFSSFKDIGDKIGEVLDTARTALKMWTVDLAADVLQKIAIAVGVLAAALVAISFINPDNIAGSLAALGGLLTAAIALLTGLNKMIKTAKPTEMLAKEGSLYILAASVTKISLAMIEIAAALKILDTIKDPDTLGSKVLAMSVMIGALAGLMTEIYLMTAKAKDASSMARSVRQIASALDAIGLSMILLTVPLKILDTIDDRDRLFADALYLVGLIAELALAMRAIKSVSGDLKGVATSITAMALGLTLLIVPITILGLIPYDVLEQGLIVVGGLLLGIAAATGVLKEIPGTLSGVPSTLMALALALTMLVVPVAILGSIRTGSAIQGIIAVFALLDALVVATKKIGQFNSGNMQGIATGILALAAALAILVIPVERFGKMPLGQLAKGFMAVAVALGGFAILVKILSPMTDAMSKFGTAMLKIAGAAALFAAAIAIIVLAFSGLAAMKDTAVEVIEDILTTVCKVISDMAAPIAETVAILVLAILDKLAAYSPEWIDKIMLLIIDMIHVLTERMPELTEALVGLFDALFGSADGYDLAKAAAMVGLIAVLGLMTAELAKITKQIPKALIGAAGCAAVLVIVGGALVGISAIPVDGVLENAAAISLALATIVPTIKLLSNVPVQGAITAVEDIAIFIAGVGAIVAALGALDTLLQGNVHTIMEKGVTILTDIGNGIGGFIGGIVNGFNVAATADLPQIGAQLSEFMSNMGPFTETFPAFAEAMADIAKARILDRIAGLFTGKSSLSRMVEQLSEVADPLMKFGQSIQGLSAYKDDMLLMANVIAEIAEAADKIPNSGGVAGFFAGENDIKDFIKQLGDCGDELKKYATKVEGISKFDLADTKRVGEIIKELSAAAENIPNEGGWAGKIFGENGIGNFANQMKRTGTATMDFAKAVEGLSSFKSADTRRATDIITQLAKVANELPNEGGWISKLVGDNTLSDFGSKLPAFGANLKAFAENISGISSYKTDVDSVYTILKGMSHITDLANSSFSLDMLNLGEQIVTNFLKSMVESDSSTADAVNKLIGNVTKNLNNKIPDVKSKMGEMGEKAIKEFANAQNKRDALTAGNAIMDQIDSAIVKKASKLVSSMTNATSQAVGAVKKAYSAFYSAGAYLGDGLVMGINSKSSAVYNAAYNTASKAASAAQAALKVHSPSRVGIQIGGYFSEGIAIGITQLGNYVSDSASDVANKAVSSMADALDQSVDIASEMVNTNPVIRPILDLSEIQNGQLQMNRLMDSIGGRTMSGTIAYATETASGINRVRDVAVPVTAAGSKTITATNNNTFNISGSNPREIAREVSEILQTDVERRIATWA